MCFDNWQSKNLYWKEYIDRTFLNENWLYQELTVAFSDIILKWNIQLQLHFVHLLMLKSWIKFWI